MHTVRPGDTLWSIAEERLGDGADWTALARLNLGGAMGGGARFVDPDQLRAGWRLRLPAGTPPEDPHLTAPTPDGGGGRSGPGSGSGRAGQPDHLPELVALGLGSLACAALARRSRRRHRPPLFVDDLALSPPPSDGAIDTGVLLRHFDGVPALESFEAANYLLARALPGAQPSPAIRAACVSPSGVSFWLARRRPDAPDGFTAVMDGMAWQVDHAALDGQPPCEPHLPIAVPVGDDGEGTWLVTLARGSVLPVLGESAAALVRAGRDAVESWAWSDQVLVTDDPSHPRLHPSPLADPRDMPPVLFIGDPGDLARDVAQRVAVMTTSAVAATDVSVLVDRQGATLHPMGRVLRPFLESTETADRIAELVAPPVASHPEPAPRRLDPTTRGLVPDVQRGPSRQPEGTHGSLAPGPIDVRLLTASPRLDGLQEELPPNRARRAVELVAYLTLHQPDVITSDRLRTRVLGSTDADAAAKTLFNTAYAARRAMGVDDTGVPLFPAGTRNGLYQVSPLVTVDAHRAIAFAAAARAHADDPQFAIAHFRAALELVEGEPLATALSGYSWWEAEGHGGRIAAVLVDAACAMSALAVDAGLFDLAGWGLERARLVEPYSEALSRAAMELAAAEGDADRLRHEWRECQRRVDALDPGSSPSLRTESLYGELSQRVLVGVSGRESGRPHTPPSGNA